VTREIVDAREKSTVNAWVFWLGAAMEEKPAPLHVKHAKEIY
jgi:hypothetical protein